MRFIDKICNLLAILAGVYLVVIMFGIVIQATLRSFNFSALLIFLRFLSMDCYT